MKSAYKGFTFLSVIYWLSTMLSQAAVDPQLRLETDQAIASFKSADSGMERLFREAEGYAVFPTVSKGGFVVGAAHGDGLVFEKGQLIGRAELTQVTVGAQIGGQVYSEIVFFQNKATLEQFEQSTTQMSAQVSAVAAAEGVAQNAKYVDGVLIFTRAKKGFMAEASAGGQKFQFFPITPEARK